MSCLLDNFSKEELTAIVNDSFSYAEVLLKLGYSTKSGSNRIALKKRLEFYGISVQHFHQTKLQMIWKDEEIFCEDSKVSQKKLRGRYKELNLTPYKCSICGLEPFWNGKELVLTLDHINGKNKDNQLHNLR